MEPNAKDRRTDITPPVPAPPGPRCEQCGEALDPKQHQTRPLRARCVYCAFETLPCTD